MKRANNVTKQHCRTNTINNISIYKNPIELNGWYQNIIGLNIEIIGIYSDIKTHSL